jgi:uncharacterized protein
MEEKIFIKNSKGLKLASVIRYPDKEKAYPAIIILHGFNGHKKETHLEELAKTSAQSGFVSIRFDCSGSGESEGRFGIDYHMSNYLKDIKCVYEYLKGLDFVDKSKINILGHSMGGMLSVIFASRHPRIRTCVAISSPTKVMRSNWIKSGLNFMRNKAKNVVKNISKNKRRINVPFSFLADSMKFNTLHFMPDLQCPFLAVLGLADDIVSPGDTRRIFQIANHPKELVEIEGAGHDYHKYPEFVETINEKILDFIKKHI